MQFRMILKTYMHKSSPKRNNVALNTIREKRQRQRQNKQGL